MILYVFAHILLFINPVFNSQATKVRQECRLSSSDDLSIMKTRRNNNNYNNSSLTQNITSTANTNVDNSSKTDINNYNTTTETTMTKDVLKDGLNDTKDRSPYEVAATKDHNIKIRSSINDVNSTQTEKISEAMTFFGDQKNLENVMNMLQTFLKAKLVENNNTEILKSTIFTQITTIPPTKPTEVATENKSKNSDMIKVLATFVFNKPIPVEPHYQFDEEKNALLSKLLDDIAPKSAKTNRREEYINDETKTTELFADQDYMSYNMKTGETTSSVDDDNKLSLQSNVLVDQMMNQFRIKSKTKPKYTSDYEKNKGAFTSSQNENVYVPDLKNIVKSQANLKYDQQRQLDDSDNSTFVDIIKPNKSYINNYETDKSLHPDVIKEIADKVKEIILRDLKKEILASTVITSSTVTTTRKILTNIPQKLEKNQNHIQQATKLVELLAQLNSVKEFIASPVKYESSKEGDKNSVSHVDVKERDSHNQIKPENKIPTVAQNDCNKMIGYIPNVATINGQNMPSYDKPIQYHQQYPIAPYYDNTSNRMFPPLISNPYGVQQPGGHAIINVPQEMLHHKKLNTINIITPVNHTPVININQMRPEPITIQTSKEIPPLGIPVSIPASMNQNIVIPMHQNFVNFLNETERERWEYILKYNRNPDTRGELSDLKDKLSQYTNFKNTPNKLIKKTAPSILNFSLTNKRGKLPDYTKFSLPTFNIQEQDKRDDSTVFGSSLLKMNEPDRLNYPKMFNLPAVTREEQDIFKKNNLPNSNVLEADRTSSSKTFNSLAKQEREGMINPKLNIEGQAKDTTVKKLNINYKQQPVYDEAVLSDIKSNILYKDRYKTDEEYRGLTNRQPLTSSMADIPNHGYYDQPNVYKPRFLEANANYPNIDPYIKRDYNEFSMHGPYQENLDIGKPRDLYVQGKYKMAKQIHDIKGFHEKLERGDFYERRDPINVNGWYDNPNMPRQYDVTTNKHDETDYSKANIESRQQLPLNGRTRLSKFDDTHFKNFLKTQQKVNDMLERILATKTSPEYSVETP